MDDVVRVFDTTLRDGEQSPGASMSLAQKVEVATQLELLGVDTIEAGFPAASPSDVEAVRAVSHVVRNAEVAALARCTRGDIDIAIHALKPARRPVLHLFIATSDIHLKHKLRRSRTEIMRQVAEMVAYARCLCSRVEFSAEDATRSDLDYLAWIADAAVRAGADTINLPDTVGYAMPEEYAAMFRYVRERVDASDTVFSAHCHDDLGLATANTLAAVKAGARQVEVTINGMGERAGNAPLEEVVMALRTRAEQFGGTRTDIQSPRLVASSRLVSGITGLAVQVNKAVVGANAFSHEAGIHQDGVLKERTTYEIMSAEDVGWESNRLVLGRHSGRHGMSHRLAQLGYHFEEATLDLVYAGFLQAAARYREIGDDTLCGIADDVLNSLNAPAPLVSDVAS